MRVCGGLFDFCSFHVVFFLGEIGKLVLRWLNEFERMNLDS